MSQPNWKGPLGLGVALTVLSLTAYWSEFSRKPKKEEAEEQEKKIVNLKDKTISSLFVSNGLGMDLTFNCIEGVCKTGGPSKWEIAEPLKVKADDGNINSLVSAFNNLTSSDTISLKDETPEKKNALLKEYGLDQAQIASHHDREVIFTTADGVTAVYLGQQHPIGDGIFAAVERVPAGQKATGKFDENIVYVLPNFLKANFDKDLAYWRNKKLFTVQTHDISEFHLKGTKLEVEATRNQNAWTLKTQGKEVPGDNEGVETLLTGATYLVAKTFVTDNKTDERGRAALKGAKPIITFSFTKQSAPAPSPSASPALAASNASEKITLVLYQKADGKPEKNGAVHVVTYGTVSNLDPLFELENFSKDRLDKDLKDLRLSKLITAMDRFSAKNLKFEGANLEQPVILNIKDSKWVQPEDVKASEKIDIDSDKIQNLLDKLSSVKITEFIPASKKPFGSDTKNQLKMSIGDGTSLQKHQFEFWKVVEKEGAKLYARDLASGQSEIFVMDNQLSDALPWDKTTFTKAQKK